MAALDLETIDFGMFSAEGNQAVREAITPLLARIRNLALAGDSHDLENLIEDVYRDVVDAVVETHEEVLDTDVRETVWDVAEQAAGRTT